MAELTVSTPSPLDAVVFGNKRVVYAAFTTITHGDTWSSAPISRIDAVFCQIVNTTTATTDNLNVSFSTAAQPVLTFSVTGSVPKAHVLIIGN